MSKAIVLSANEWNPENLKFMQPKVSSLGTKAITLISTQTNRSLHLSTPLMMTWGISDFVDEKGEGGGKYTMPLNFPSDDYRTQPTDDFLQKIQRFENVILDKAVEYSEVWWGETMSREVIKHMLFPMLKYSKNKDTKKIDMTRPPSIRVKVPCYEGKWNCEVYDTKMNLLFPSEDESLTPLDFVTKLSNVACVIQCTGVWIGGKGWGLTWKLVQAIVKPRETQTVFGKCHVMLSNDEMKSLTAGGSSTTVDDGELEDEIAQVKVVSKPVPKQAPTPAPVVDTAVEDSDDESEIPPPPALSRQNAVVPDEPVPAPAPAPEPTPVTEEITEEMVAAADVTVPSPVTKTVVKKIVKKKVTPA
jgi:hypothetical protein